MKIKVVGVYPVEAPEPCHLLELVFDSVDDAIDFMEFTQQVRHRPRDSWQVPWDERFLDVTGEREIDPDAPDVQPAVDRFRVVFFFHYLDHGRPLLSPAGPLSLPEPTVRPQRLAFVHYESPC